MSEQASNYTRLGRILARMDFTWGVTLRTAKSVAKNDAWLQRYRPGGPHALWILGHLAYIESGALKRYTKAEVNPLLHWKELFDGGTEPVDDLAHYPPASEVLETFESARTRLREYVSQLSDSELDEVDVIDRIAVRDRQSHIEFMLWHDAHHGAQLAGIAATAKDQA